MDINTVSVVLKNVSATVSNCHTIPTDKVIWTRVGAPVVERIFIGGTYLVLALVFLFLQISILSIFFVYDEYRKNACYRCIIIISIADALQLIVHCYGGIITICDNSFSPILEKFLGGLCNAICITLLPLGTVLALNRLVIFLGLIDVNRTRFFFDMLIGASCAWGAAFFALYMTPNCGMAFRNYAWGYDLSLPWSEQVELIDSQTTIPMLVLPFTFYLIIFGVIIAKRHSFTIQYEAKGQKSALLGPQEARLLAQCVIFFGCEASLLVIWHMAGELFPDSPYTIAAINYYWILYNGINPILYFTLNKTIRNRFIRLLREGKTSAYTTNLHVSQRPEAITKIPSNYHP